MLIVARQVDREQGSVPAEEALVGERVAMFLGGVEHHLDDAFDIAVGGHR